MVARHTGCTVGHYRIFDPSARTNPHLAMDRDCACHCGLVCPGHGVNAPVCKGQAPAFRLEGPLDFSQDTLQSYSPHLGIDLRLYHFSAAPLHSIRLQLETVPCVRAADVSVLRILGMVHLDFCGYCRRIGLA